jgi:hypothetical protein
MFDASSALSDVLYVNQTPLVCMSVQLWQAPVRPLMAMQTWRPAGHLCDHSWHADMASCRTAPAAVRGTQTKASCGRCKCGSVPRASFLPRSVRHSSLAIRAAPFMPRSVHHSGASVLGVCQPRLCTTAACWGVCQPRSVSATALASCGHLSASRIAPQQRRWLLATCM